jgi:hypothetical protein
MKASIKAGACTLLCIALYASMYALPEWWGSAGLTVVITAAAVLIVLVVYGVYRVFLGIFEDKA